MTTWRYDNPPALVIEEERRVEILDLRRWRRIAIENRLAREFLECLDPERVTSTPLLETLQALAEPSFEILFALIRQKQRQIFEAETLCPVPPDQIWLELTSQCNEQCVHCYAPCPPGPLYRALGQTLQCGLDKPSCLGPLRAMARWESSIRQTLRAGVFVLTNGWPSKRRAQRSKPRRRTVPQDQ